MFLMDAKTLLIIGNVIAVIGMGLFFISAVLKTKKGILGTQVLSHVVNILSELCLGQFSATIGEGVNIIRNGFILKNKNTRLVSILLIIIGATAGVTVNVFFNNNSLIGYIPVITSLLYSIVVLIPNVGIVPVKLAMVCSTSLFSVYSLLCKNYVMGVGNIIIAITTIISIVLFIRDNKNKENKEKEIGKEA